MNLSFPPLTRYCIVGTAPNYLMAPWEDQSIVIASLNDAYQLDGIKRADEWVDLHPLDQYWSPPLLPDGKRRMAAAHEVPVGKYVRPDTHLQWLANRKMPVWLHPAYATQRPEATAWPTARAFPRREIEEHFGEYQMSTPALMLAHAIMRGATEVQVYGINLSTEQEYIDQRPQFEHMIGCLLGAGKRRFTTKDGRRYIQTEKALLVLPASSPVLQGSYRYGLEPSPTKRREPIKWELHKAQIKQQRRIQALVNTSWWTPFASFDEPDSTGVVRTHRVRVSTLKQDIVHYGALLDDYRDQLTYLSGGR